MILLFTPIYLSLLPVLLPKKGFLVRVLLQRPLLIIRFIRCLFGLWKHDLGVTMKLPELVFAGVFQGFKEENLTNFPSDFDRYF